MSLQKLVEHFNHNFAKEHECDFHPFVLKNNQVTGIFGIAHITSKFAPVHSLSNIGSIISYAAKAVTSNHENLNVKTEKITRLLTKTLNKPAHVRSIITFDRLCRTVNLLNYLELANRNNFLITEVDPRHILSVPYNHGAYFEEIIVYSGLRTQNVVVSMTIAGVHQEHYPKLLQGLNNYRECGYQIALNIGYLISADKTLDLIKQLAPDYVIVAAPNESYARVSLNASLIAALEHLKKLTVSLGGKIILQDVQRAEQTLCAVQLGFDAIQLSFDLAQEAFYENLSSFKDYKTELNELNYLDYSVA